ncbi:MAG TPA: branched-chain amino acid ABC transporter substrate-binding protein [Burkholderiaceae bacterium]|nr:branched-chain amino acid ABC transporter substrate-binding protein [Burkholderiaceae bacterium]
MTLHRNPWNPLFVLAAAAVLSACGPKIPDTITIAVAQPLSGPQAGRGQDLLNGAKLAVDEINKSGYKIAGKPVTIELLPVDDKADPAEAKKVAQDLVDRQVFAVLGHLSSDITEATIPIYKQGNVVQLFTSSAAELTKQGEGNAFRLVANDAMQAKAVASYAGETLRAANVAIVYENSAYGNPMRADIVADLKKAKKKLSLDEQVDGKATDFAPLAAKLKASPPDVLIAVLREHQLLPLLAQVKAAGMAELPVIATSTGKTSKVAKAPVDVAKLYSTISSAEPREFSSGSEFLSKFRAAYKSDPVWAAHYAYDAMYVLTHTLRAVGSVDKDALRAKLRTIDAIAPVTGTMRFNATGEQLYGAITVYERRDGTWWPLVRSDQW